MVDYSQRLTFQRATVENVEAIADHMRAADVEEVLLSSGKTPHDAIVKSVEMSRDPVMVALDGEPIAAIGVAPTTLMSRVGSPWMLGTDEVSGVGRAVLIASSFMVRQWRKDYTLLQNYVYTGHHHSIRWLGWLGFTIHDPEPWGVSGAMFHKFTMTRDV